jgi:hypothetical protein
MQQTSFEVYVFYEMIDLTTIMQEGWGDLVYKLFELVDWVPVGFMHTWYVGFAVCPSVSYAFRPPLHTGLLHCCLLTTSAISFFDFSFRLARAVHFRGFENNNPITSELYNIYVV